MNGDWTRRTMDTTQRRCDACFPRRSLLLTAFVPFALLTASCKADPLGQLPNELELSNVIYEERVEHAFGPAGINKGFHVLQLSERVAKEIRRGKLSHLNGLTSSKDAENEKAEVTKRAKAVGRSDPYNVGYSGWQVGPILMSPPWKYPGRRPRPGDTPKLTSFYGIETTFVSRLNAIHARAAQDAIDASDSFYAYGGYRANCVLLISLSQMRAYYLFLG